MVRPSSGGIFSNLTSANLSLTSNTSRLTTSFTEQLAATLEEYLAGPSPVLRQVNIQTQQSRNPNVQQSLIKVASSVQQLPSAEEPKASVTPEATPLMAVEETATASTTTDPSKTSTPAKTNSPAPSAPTKSILTEADAYWATQPAAVQVLRDMPDGERWGAAQDLANRGYTIDVPIMVWGWDPLAIMTVRQNQGFTWVPSGLQAPIPVMPGCSMPGQPSYDPNNPPAGSIQVTTAFAKGLESTCPWIRDDSTAI